MSLASRSTDLLIGLIATVVLAGGSATGLLPFSTTEVAGFLTGGASVWLLVREHVWNWPVGIVNSGLYFVIFLEARLFADSALQLGFVVLGFAGWWMWLRGARGSALRIGRVGPAESLALAVATAAATVGLDAYLVSVHDSAPFLDSLTTSLSLAATYLQARKLIETWLVWIAADLIYVPLYVWKHLALTGLLYVVFLAMCVRGLVGWRRALEGARA